MKIGIINLGGPLGQGIRTRAFLNVIRKSKFVVEDVNIPSLSWWGKLKAALLNPKDTLSPGSIGIRKIENFAGHSARRLDQIVEKTGIDVLQAETTLGGYIWLKSRRKCPCILDMHGLSYEQRVRQGLIKKDTEHRYWRKLQEDVIKNCRHVFAVSTDMADYLADYVSRDKITVVRNAGEVLPYQAVFSRPLRVVYAGIFEYWEKVEDFLKMSNQAGDCQFFMMGEGRLKRKIMKEKHNLTYLGSFSREEALKKMAGFQIGIATSTDDITRRVASPIKVFDYLSVGLPVICPEIGEWSRIIKDNDCGMVVGKNEPGHFIGAVRTIDEANWRRMSTNGRRLIREEFNWDNVIRTHAFPAYEKTIRS